MSFIKRKKLCALLSMCLFTGYASADSTSKLDSITVNSDWLGETSEESVKTYAGSREVLTSQAV